MAGQRRSFGSIEKRAGYFRARYVGPDQRRYEAPRAFVARIDAEYWLGEVQREIVRDEWRPPLKGYDRGSDLDLVSGFSRKCLEERQLTPRTREEYAKLLEHLILPTLGHVRLRHLTAEHIRTWYSAVLSEDRPTQRKHAYSLLRSILRDAEDEGLIARNPCRIRNAGRVRRTREIEPATPAELNRLLELPPRQGPPRPARWLVWVAVGRGPRSPSPRPRPR